MDNITQLSHFRGRKCTCTGISLPGVSFALPATFPHVVHLENASTIKNQLRDSLLCDPFPHLSPGVMAFLLLLIGLLAVFVILYSHSLTFADHPF